MQASGGKSRHEKQLDGLMDGFAEQQRNQLSDLRSSMSKQASS
jgi:hypothetical protein